MKKFLSNAFALILAGVLVSCGNQGSSESSAVQAVAPVAEGSAQLSIAYLNVDSLLSGYNFAIDLNEAMLKKAEDARMKLNTKQASLEKEINDHGRKLQTNAYMSQERAMSVEQNLQRRYESLQQEAADLQDELARQQAVMLSQLNDTIQNFLKEYNAEKQYQMILNGATLMIEAPQYDITADVLSRLNARYVKTEN